MSATGRPEREYRSAQREGSPVSATGRPEREYRSAQREGSPVSANGRPESEFRSAKHEGSPVSGKGTEASLLPILHRDEWLVAIHKPAGLLVHRTALDRHETRFAVQLLRDQIGQRVYPAHRLDRGTSGVLLFALDRDVARSLGAQFEAREVAKRYVAIVRGHPPETGTIDHPLARADDDDDFGTTKDGAGAARDARTHFRRLAVAELPHAVDRYPTSRYALVELEPVTGRRHQIRRHLKHIAHPVIGDATYGKGRHNRLFTRQFGNERMLLACVEMRVRHPVRAESLVLRAAPGDDFARVARALGWEPALDATAPPTNPPSVPVPASCTWPPPPAPRDGCAPACGPTA